jgi:uncharacterized BrkB/YihY/UPF0761 family membrane protein
MSTSALLLYIFLASASFAYIIYGKQQRDAAALLNGISLGALAYFDLPLWQMGVTTLLLLVLPFLLHRFLPRY